MRHRSLLALPLVVAMWASAHIGNEGSSNSEQVSEEKLRSLLSDGSNYAVAEADEGNSFMVPPDEGGRLSGFKNVFVAPKGEGASIVAPWPACGAFAS